MTDTRRIQGLLREVNHCRRLWRAWNEHMLERHPGDQNHYAVAFELIHNEVRNALFFRLVVRLYALMEGDEDRGAEKKEFTFGVWLDSLPSDAVIDVTKEKYVKMVASDDFVKMREKRHNFLAHNALAPREIIHSYGGVFSLSELLEQLYAEVAQGGFAISIPWDVDIEENVSKFFQRLSL